MQFDIDRDINGAAHDVQAAINAAITDLPSDLPTRPYYRKFNPAAAPIMTLALSSDTLRTAQIYDAADTVLVSDLSQVDGVSNVTQRRREAGGARATRSGTPRRRGFVVAGRHHRHPQRQSCWSRPAASKVRAAPA